MKKKRRNILFIPLQSMHKCAFTSLALVAAGVGCTYLYWPIENVLLWLIPCYIAGAWAIAAIVDITDHYGQ